MDFKKENETLKKLIEVNELLHEFQSIDRVSILNNECYVMHLDCVRHGNDKYGVILNDFLEALRIEIAIERNELFDKLKTTNNL